MELLPFVELPLVEALLLPSAVLPDGALLLELPLPDGLLLVDILPLFVALLLLSGTRLSFPSEPPVFSVPEPASLFGSV